MKSKTAELPQEIMALSDLKPNPHNPNGHPEKQKFSIVELKRICAFPDDFELLGTFSQQWERLGNCVPPMMMYYISKAVQEGVLDKGRR